jgi:hypothetical protein
MAVEAWKLAQMPFQVRWTDFDEEATESWDLLGIGNGARMATPFLAWPEILTLGYWGLGDFYYQA